MTARSVDERGAISILGTAVIGLVLFLAFALLPLAAAMSARMELETAADASALAAVGAAVAGGRPATAARQVARLNGSRLRMCQCPRFEGASFTATVGVSRTVVLPLIGERVVLIQRSAEYEVGP